LVWGSYFLGAPTLFRLYSVHFFLPFVILFLVVIHLWQLHVNGSRNPRGLPLSRERCKFYSLYFFKDIVTPCIVYFIFVGLVSYSPWVFRDPGNFIEAESLVTPLHIKPEWYFLFAYAILRSIPTKIGGVIAMGLSVTIYYVLPYLPKPFYFKGNYFNPVGKLVFVTFVFSVLRLT
jgi:ubiquinol-cytochrome c reductase cytochrome b subunit